MANRQSTDKSTLAQEAHASRATTKNDIMQLARKLENRTCSLSSIYDEVRRQQEIVAARAKLHKNADKLTNKTLRAAWHQAMFRAAVKSTLSSLDADICAHGYECRVDYSKKSDAGVYNQTEGEYYAGSWSNKEVSTMRPWVDLNLYNLKTMRVIAGVLTFSERDGSDFWIENGRGNSAKIERGLVIDGTHIVGESKAKCLRKYAIARKRQEKAELRAAQHKAGKLFWITFDDSISAGNCKAGTLEFCKKHNINVNSIGAIRSDLMFELEDSTWTRRAYGAATHAFGC